MTAIRDTSSSPPPSGGTQPGSSGLSSSASSSPASSSPASPAASTKATAPRRQRRRERPNGFPAWRRLRNTREFARVERQGARASGELLAITVRPGPGRIGLVVSKKVDNRAVVRNTIKRRLRDIFRQEKARYASRAGGTVDVVITARAPAAFATREQLKVEALRFLEQALSRLSHAGDRRR
ncbi:MAG TPA: ribonuclease P protein component [Myxococcota bacterium]